MNSITKIINGQVLPHGKNGGKLLLAKQLFSEGHSARAVSRKLNMGINTACRVLHLLGDQRCKCGTLIRDHRGWCAYRFQQSEKRRIFWERLHEIRFGKTYKYRKPEQKLSKIVKQLNVVFDLNNAIDFFYEDLLTECCKILKDNANGKLFLSFCLEKIWIQSEEFVDESKAFFKWATIIIHESIKSWQKEEFNYSQRKLTRGLVTEYHNGKEVLFVKESQDSTLSLRDNYQFDKPDYGTVTKGSDYEYQRMETFLYDILNDWSENQSPNKIPSLANAYNLLLESDFDFLNIKTEFENIFNDEIGWENVKFFSKEKPHDE